MATQGLNAGDF